MSIYVVGDIQGCLGCLKTLLRKLEFSEDDQLWSVGDLVNRGPESLETLRFCKNLGARFRTVLGNHDLSLLAIARGAKSPSRKDTIDDVLAAPDRDDLLNWLQAQPLLIRHQDYALVHAGLPPQWSLEDASGYAAELETALADPAQSQAFFSAMFGDYPDGWSNDLVGLDRLRVITNYFTRLRYCDSAGRMDFNNKLPPGQGPEGFLPWFAHPHRRTRNNKLVFGHWASLEGQTEGDNLFPLDTGCVWGGKLRIMSLEDERYFHHDCKNCV
jgi:bis(5'-nucleosyl)-tetraphosphatase (symmetrical)